MHQHLTVSGPMLLATHAGRTQLLWKNPELYMSWVSPHVLLPNLKVQVVACQRTVRYICGWPPQCGRLRCCSIRAWHGPARYDFLHQALRLFAADQTQLVTMFKYRLKEHLHMNCLAKCMHKTYCSRHDRHKLCVSHRWCSCVLCNCLCDCTAA